MMIPGSEVSFHHKFMPGSCISPEPAQISGRNTKTPKPKSGFGGSDLEVSDEIKRQR